MALDYSSDPSRVEFIFPFATGGEDVVEVNLGSLVPFWLVFRIVFPFISQLVVMSLDYMTSRSVYAS